MLPADAYSSRAFPSTLKTSRLHNHISGSHTRILYQLRCSALPYRAGFSRKQYYCLPPNPTFLQDEKLTTGLLIIKRHNACGMRRRQRTGNECFALLHSYFMFTCIRPFLQVERILFNQMLARNLWSAHQKNVS